MLTPTKPSCWPDRRDDAQFLTSSVSPDTPTKEPPCSPQHSPHRWSAPSPTHRSTDGSADAHAFGRTGPDQRPNERRRRVISRTTPEMTLPHDQAQPVTGTSPYPATASGHQRVEARVPSTIGYKSQPSRGDHHSRVIMTLPVVDTDGPWPEGEPRGGPIAIPTRESSTIRRSVFHRPSIAHVVTRDLFGSASVRIGVPAPAHSESEYRRARAYLVMLRIAICAVRPRPLTPVPSRAHGWGWAS